MLAKGYTYLINLRLKAAVLFKFIYYDFLSTLCIKALRKTLINNGIWYLNENDNLWGLFLIMDYLQKHLRPGEISMMEFFGEKS